MTPPRNRSTGPARVLLRSLLGLWWILAVAGVAQAAESQEFDLSPEAAIPVNPRVRMGILENGLHWYVQENTEPEDRAELRLVVNVGSVLEEDDQRGLAHFVEHMAFNGTDKYHAQALVDYLERTGMRFGPDINAVTSFDRTMYMLTVPTDEDSLLGRGLEILAEWSRHIQFDPVEVDKERGVVLEERRGRLGSGQRVQDQHLPVTYHDSKYAQRLPIGTVEVLESATAADLRKFYRQWYRPELMAVIAVGDFESQRVIAQIEDDFGGDWGVHDGPERVTVAVPEHDHSLFSIVADPENPSSTLRLQLKMPRRRTERVGDYRISLREILYDRMLNERLYEITQRPEPPFTSAYVGQSGLGRTLDMDVMVIGADEGGLPKALESTLVEARRAATYGYTPAELERAKARLMRSVESEYAEREQTPSATYAGRYAGNFLDDSPIPGVEFRYALFEKLLPEIELSELREIRRPWFEEANRVLLVSVPEKEDLLPPTEGDFREVFDRAAAVELTPWTEENSDAPLMTELPTPGSVVHSEHLDDVDITIWTLSNGVQVFLKQTDFQDDEVLLQAWSPGGSSLGPRDPSPSQSMAAYITRLGGLGPFDRVELGRKLAGKRAGVSPSISTYSEGLDGAASPKDLETLLQLTYLEFTAPRVDPEALRSQSTRLEAGLRNRSLVPESVYSDSLSAILFRHDPWVRPLRVEDIPGLDAQEAVDFYRQRFADANDFHFFFVGSFDEEALRTLVERYLASLPTLETAEQPRDIGLRRRREPGHFVVQAGLEPKALTTLTVSGPMEWNREQRHRISSTGEALQIRLREVLREDLSGTYGVSAGASSQRFPEPIFRVTIRFGCDPARLDELVGEVGRVIHGVVEQGFDPETIEKVQEAQRRDFEGGMRTNGFWIQGMVTRDRWELPQDQILETPAVIDGLTPEMVHETAGQIFDWEQFLRFDLLPAESPADAIASPDSPETKD